MISLDGVMQAPGGPEEDPSGGFDYGGWVAPYFDDVYDKVVQDELKPAEYLLGRKTFEIWAGYWPSGVSIIAISTFWEPKPVTRPAHSPSIVARPSRVRPSSSKKEMAPLRDSTTIPILCMSGNLFFIVFMLRIRKVLYPDKFFSR